ncbi:MAG: hypothetical protein AAF418_05430, partial [Pseudomonadota bacterium]
SVGLPGTSGFVGEFLVLVGAFAKNTWLALGLASAMVLGAAYMLWLYRRVLFGALTLDSLKAIADINRRELAVFVPLACLILWMGLYPMSFIRPIEPALAKIVVKMEAAEARLAERSNGYRHIVSLEQTHLEQTHLEQTRLEQTGLNPGRAGE